MTKGKKSPHEVEARRVTWKDVEETFRIARERQDVDLLRWSYVMQEILHIRQLLEQQNQSSDCGDSRGNSADDKGGTSCTM